MLKRLGGLFIGVVVSAGSNFGQDAAVSGSSSKSEDPFVDEGRDSQLTEIASKRVEQKTAGVEVRIEIFDLPTLRMIQLLDEKMSAEQLRKDVLDLVVKEEGQVVEVVLVHTEAGLSATVEGICETIYPTEYEPPGGFPNLRKMQAEAKALVEEGSSDEKLSPLEAFVDQLAGDATPTAFETRNLGTTVEVLVKSVVEEKGVWDISLSPEIVAFVGERSWMGGTVKMPIFTCWRTNQSFRMLDGEWMLASTCAIGSLQSGTDSSHKRLMFLKVEQTK